MLRRLPKDGDWILYVLPVGRVANLFGIVAFRSAGPVHYDADGLLADLQAAAEGRYADLSYACFKRKCETVPSALYR